MAKSFQHEKPPARINLSLDVETGGAQVKKELSFRMLMVGDYTGRDDDTPVEEREIVNINKDNFEQVMQSQNLEAGFTVPDRLRGGDEEMAVNLTFDQMKDFEPEQVVKQVPELSRMLSMRNLLQDLRNRIVDAREFRKELEKIVQDKDQLDKLAAQLDRFIVRDDAEGEADEGEASA